MKPSSEEAIGYARKRLTILPVAIYALLVVVTLGFVGYYSYAYYTWPCQQLRTSWLTSHSYAPVRCIP